MSSPSPKYILDTGFFIVARDFYPTVFPGFWKAVNDAVSNNVISSVHEVFREIENFGGEQPELLDWAKNNMGVFTEPSPSEEEKLRDLLANFPLRKKEATMLYKPWADRFVIARAWDKGATIVTREKSNRKSGEKLQHAHKIPDICSHPKIDVRCITPQEFMKEMEWRF